MTVTIVFSLWLLVTVFAFKRYAPQNAVLLVLLGGWIMLPVGVYPPGAAESAFPYWIIGAALPSDMLVSKAWAAPLCAILGVAWFDFQRLSTVRLSRFDMPMILWCVWPMLQWLYRAEAQPQPVLASAYLLGCWGLPWLLGRLYFGNLQAQTQLLTGFAWAGLVCLPFAVLEGAFGPFLYSIVYEAHPFNNDGSSRYWGWRPLGFFENGNQYGLWMCMCALASLWVWRSQVTEQLKTRWRWIAAAVLGMAVMAQSVGALALLGIGVGSLGLMKRIALRWAMALGLSFLALGLAVYLTGVVPVAHLGKETNIGRKVVEVFKTVGRQSFTWRISQDQKAIELAKPFAVAGSGKWDWWQSLGVRPWGLVLLIVGQYGLIGLALAIAASTLPAIRQLWNSPRGSPWSLSGAPKLLAVIVLLTWGDAAMNSFVFFPALVAAGALAKNDAGN